jgi:hypothetical protein
VGSHLIDTKNADSSKGDNLKWDSQRLCWREKWGVLCT